MVVTITFKNGFRYSKVCSKALFRIDKGYILLSKNNGKTAGTIYLNDEIEHIEYTQG